MTKKDLIIALAAMHCNRHVSVCRDPPPRLEALCNDSPMNGWEWRPPTTRGLTRARETFLVRAFVTESKCHHCLSVSLSVCQQSVCDLSHQAGSLEKLPNSSS